MRSTPATTKPPAGFPVVLKDPTAEAPVPLAGGGPDLWQKRLAHAIDHAAHLLPAQGPITVFIHHNTLHAFEDRPFEEAVVRGAEAFGCQPYLAEERFRAELGRGRIRFDGLKAVLRDDLGPRADEPVAGLCSRMDLRLAMLQHPVGTAPQAELDYYLAETDALRQVRPDVSAAARGRLVAEARRWAMRDLRGRTGPGVPAWSAGLFGRFGADRVESGDDTTWEAFALEALWNVCLDGVRNPEPGTRNPESGPEPPVLHSAFRVPRSAFPQRHRDLLLAVTDADPDLWVHDLLIRYCAAFLDQGISHWPLPDRGAGFYRCFLTLYSRPGGPPDAWLGGLRAEAERLLSGNVAPLDSARESLDLLGVPEAEWDAYLSAALLALRGWGGIIRHVEERPDRVAHPVPAGSLAEFAAVRLLLDRLAAAHAAQTELGYSGPLAGLRDELRRRLPAGAPPTAAQRAFPLFQLAQLLGWAPDELHRLEPADWSHLLAEVEGFHGVERRRVFHLAYERRFRVQTLDALALHRPQPFPPGFRPRFQVFTCIDEREESFRRHLEEVAPDGETFGAPGFYGVAMYYRGAAEAHYVPLCPIVVVPGHWVEEQVPDDHRPAYRQRAKARRAVGAATHRLHLGTRSFAAGAVLSAGVGALAAVPLVARVLFPRLAARVKRWFGEVVHTPPKTRLKLERAADPPSPDGDHLGYTLAEMTTIAEGQLRSVGLTRNFARLVVILGHGSHSMNNPHESAHDCGACGGAVGGPNGRAVAQILNDPRVRAGLAERGLVIPADTVFVGGLHNTCNEYVKLADKDRIPGSHLEVFHEAEAAIEEALARNAHERARRFESAPLAITPAAARQHMDARAEDLAQVRPEWGHATNAITIVGRRSRTRGLFLDRRAFMNSYDPTQDDADGTILGRILGAAVPVCAGISLEYYFCHVDPAGYGCGTKLPHNITSLLGVMDGAASDLRTGLPWQMVEIHEPVRNLFVVETRPEVMLRIMARNPVIDVHVRNGWVQMAVQDPDTGAIRVYRDGAFEPYTPQAAELPRAPTSVDWYRGWRGPLEFAEIGPPEARNPEPGTRSG